MFKNLASVILGEKKQFIIFLFAENLTKNNAMKISIRVSSFLGKREFSKMSTFHYNIKGINI